MTARSFSRENILMASKYDKLRARLRTMREKTEQGLKNTLHAGETLVAGSVTAYASGRLADANGEWGFRGVPYPLVGGLALYAVGFAAGDRYSSDLFAAGTGVLGAYVFRKAYTYGLDARDNRTTGHRRTVQALHHYMGAASRVSAPQPQAVRVPLGSAYEGVK
jgi:hypothetical protein